MNDWNNDIEDDQLESECMREDNDSYRDEPKNEIIIKRILKFGETPCFKVYSNGEIQRVFSFHLNKPGEDLYNEEVNLLKAKAFVDELRNFKESETIIDY